jgi:hypothetical protein
MTEEKESAPVVQRASSEDWNPDRFPTSARPVFRGLGLLFGLIGVLCFLVYYFSDNSLGVKKESDRQQAIEEEFLPEDLDDPDAAFDPLSVE